MRIESPACLTPLLACAARTVRQICHLLVYKSPWLAAAGIATAIPGAPAARAADTAYLFTYFTHNGQSGLHLAWSEDGYKWRPVQDGRSFLTPEIGTKEKLIRDPCVVRGPDGTYHMVWTSGWWERGIGYASTKDFITWSPQKEIPVMAHEPTARNSWAPEIFYDDARGEFVIFWATTIPGRYPQDTGAAENDTNHRMYCTTTRDFETFTPTELFYDPGFNCIDATLLRTDAGLAIIVKDETKFPVAAKNLRAGPAASARGPFGPLGEPFTPPGMWVEGPSALKIGEHYVVYFDAYIEKHYRAMRSRDLATWEDATARMEFPFEGTPERMRHGTVIEVPRALIDGLLNPAAVGAVTAIPAPADERPTIFIAGDSTAAAYGSGPHQGWGVPFEKYWDPTLVRIDNRARGGRSSRTFISEGLWDKLIADVKPGDSVLIQLGQNDGSPVNEDASVPPERRRSRGSLRGLGDESHDIVNILNGKPETVRTFGWYVRKMIADVREKGATPILLSPTIHNTWKDGSVMRGGVYREWNREVARAAGVAFVDHSRLIADEYQRLGKEATRALFPRDHVDTGPEGAEINARLAVSGLAGLRRSEFRKLLSEEGKAVKPDSIGWLNLPEPANPALPSIVLVGDSTVRNGGGDGAEGQWGWGEPFAAFIDPACANVVNRAIGGLSSRTFLTQGHWERALTLIKPGDWVLIQFGHNDGGALNDNSRARGTIRGTGHESEEIDNTLTGARETVHTYGWYLRRYIRDARERGAVPVVCTLVPRKTWKDGRIVRSAPDGYAGWAAQVAAEEGASLIDLNSLIAARYDELGPEAVNALFADAHTHTSWAGAELNAAIVAAALRKMDGFPCAVAPVAD